MYSLFHVKVPKPIKEETSSSMPETPSSSIPRHTTPMSSSSVPQTTTSSSSVPTPSSSSAPQTPSRSGEDEGTSHYSTPSNPNTSSSEDDGAKAGTGQAPPLSPISENEGFAFTPYKKSKEEVSEPESPIDFGPSPVSFMASTPSQGMEEKKTARDSPIFSDSPIDELLKTPSEIKPPSMVNRLSTPVGRRSTPLELRGTPTMRYTPGIESEREQATENTSEVSHPSDKLMYLIYLHDTFFVA